MKNSQKTPKIRNKIMSSSSTNPRWSAKDQINDFLKYGEFDKLSQACNDMKEQEGIQRMRIIDNRDKGLPVDKNLALAADKTMIEYIQLEEYVDKYLASSGPVTGVASATHAAQKKLDDTKFKYVLTHHAQKMVDKKKKDDDELKDSLQRIEESERIASRYESLAVTPNSSDNRIPQPRTKTRPPTWYRLKMKNSQ
jgi:hypothetical protein